MGATAGDDDSGDPLDDILADIEAAPEEEPAADESTDDDIDGLLDDISDDADATEEFGGDDVSDDTAVDVLDDIDAAPVPAGEVDEKPGKKKFAKKGGIGKGKKGGADLGKKGGAKGKKEKPSKDKKLPKATPPKGPRGKTLTFVCSECYTEISVSAQLSEDRVTCPDCLHVGKKPDDNFLHQVSMAKGREKSSVVLTTFIALLMIASFAMLAYVRSAWGAPEYSTEDLQTWTVGTASAGGVFTILFMILLWKSEGNRWEVYF